MRHALDKGSLSEKGRTELPTKAVRIAARIDPESAERGGKLPMNMRLNCARKTSSASGRENVRGLVDANLRAIE